MRVCSLCQRCYDDSHSFCSEESHPPLSETRGGSPEMIAGYRLDLLLESGVKGKVYSAHQTACGQSCLIRILSANEANGRQFLCEAKLAAALFHPNVVDVYEAGSLDSGEVFVVAEDPDGESLRDFLNNVGVPRLLTSIQVVRHTAEALHAIHLKGLPHRAVRPENIILTTDPENGLLVRIQNIDFGGVTEQLIVSNKFLIEFALDSLKYFAPEQCSGDGTSAQTDVYSLGIVFYEMLAGVPPFDATKAAGLIEKHRSERPPDIKIDNFELRMLVTHSLMESLQKRPDKRQSSANAFARQLRHIEQLATHVSTPPPAGVVPPAPQRSAPRATVAEASATFTIIPPAAAIETPGAIYRQNIQLGAARVEPEPAAAFKPENEPIPVIDLESSADYLHEIPDLLSAESATENFVPVIETLIEEERPEPRPHRSRMKLRRRSHPKITPLATEGQVNQLLPPVESTEIELVQVQALRAEMSVVQAEPEELAAVSVPNKPTMIEWEQPEDDIPSIEDVLEVLSKEQIAEIPQLPQMTPPLQLEPETIKAIPPKQKAASKPAPKATPKDIPVYHEDPEEITLVRARSEPIRVNLEQPRPARKSVPAGRVLSQASSEVVFFPTILGDQMTRKTIDLDPRDSFLSAYYASSRARSSVPYRSLAIGGGFLALMALFLFGNDSVRRYVQAWSSDDSAAVGTTTGRETPPRSAPKNAVSPSKKKALKTFRTPMPEDDADLNRSKPVPIKERRSVSGERSRDSSRRNAGKMSDSGKKSGKTEPAKNFVDKQPLSIPNRTDGATRPRIVKDPRP